MANDITIDLKASTEITNLSSLQHALSSLTNLGDEIKNSIQEAFSTPIEIGGGGTFGFGDDDFKGYVDNIKDDLVEYLVDIKNVVTTTKSMLRSMLPYVKPVYGTSTVEHVYTKIREARELVSSRGDMLEEGEEFLNNVLDRAMISLHKAAMSGDVKGLEKVQNVVDIIIGKLNEGVLTSTGPSRRGTETGKLSFSVMEEMAIKKFSAMSEADLEKIFMDTLKYLIEDRGMKLNPYEQHPFGAKGMRRLADIFVEGGEADIIFSLASVFTKQYSQLERGGGQKLSYASLLPYNKIQELERNLKGVTNVSEITERIKEAYAGYNPILALIAESMVGGQEVFTGNESAFVGNIRQAFRTQIEQLLKNQNLSKDIIDKVLDQFKIELVDKSHYGQFRKSYLSLKSGKEEISRMGIFPYSLTEGFQGSEAMIQALKSTEGEKIFGTNVYDKLMNILETVKEEYEERKKATDKLDVVERQLNGVISNMNGLVEIMSRIENNLREGKVLDEEISGLINMLKRWKFPVGGE